MRKAIQKEDYTRVIYDKGCLRAGEEWVERNLVPVAGVAVAISVLQVHTCASLSFLLQLETLLVGRCLQLGFCFPALLCCRCLAWKVISLLLFSCASLRRWKTVENIFVVLC